MLKAMFWRSLDQGKILCQLCPQACVIGPGQKGLCGVRTNLDGQLYSTSSDLLAASSLDPVEKKPLFHFLPGSTTFSIAAAGCNLSCQFCQNSELSQSPRLGKKLPGAPARPEQIVDMALQSGARSISYTYSEPTVFFELVVETSRLACQKGLKNILVSNGFINTEPLRSLAGFIHAANIDLKASDEAFYRDICGGQLQPVLETIALIREFGWWLELTTLLIPGLNDSPEQLNRTAGLIAGFSQDIPWHVSRFHPCYRMLNLPVTPLSSIAAALEAGRARALNYVYPGNVPGNNYENTFCPNCGQEVMARQGFRSHMTGFGAVPGQCGRCGQVIPGVWSD